MNYIHFKRCCRFFKISVYFLFPEEKLAVQAKSKYKRKKEAVQEAGAASRMYSVTHSATVGLRWWFLQSECRRSRSNKLMSRNLHQKMLTTWDWWLNSVFTKLFIEMVTCVMLVHTHTWYLNTQLLTAAAHNRGIKHSFTNNTW